MTKPIATARISFWRERGMPEPTITDVIEWLSQLDEKPVEGYNSLRYSRLKIEAVEIGQAIESEAK